MDVKAYLLKLISAALLCGVVKGFFDEKGAVGAVLKMMCGIVMLLTAVSPWTNLQLNHLTDYFERITMDAETIVASGENMASQELETIIKSRMEAYILDKAESYGAKLTVEVILSDDQVPTPKSVRISGSISPYGKQMMSRMIREDLGIATEDQIWTG